MGVSTDHTFSIIIIIKELVVPEFRIRETWSIQRLTGYLRTWSAVQHYERLKGQDPVALIEKELQKTFGRSGMVEFPILLRVGKIPSKKVSKKP